MGAERSGMALGLGSVRDRLAAEVFARVAGPDGDEQARRIHQWPGPRWFGPDEPIRRVHGDASMFVGGIRALLLQSLHPLAMAGVAGHSGFRSDPWGRLQRTSRFLAVTTFATAEDAEEMVATIRRVHSRVRGTAPDGRPYAASEPHLLKWVHVAEVDSFLAAHQVYGAHPLDRAERDRYVANTAVVAGKLGVVDPPRSYAELQRDLYAYVPELHSTPESRDAARFLLQQPPLPLPAHAVYGLLAGAAVGLLPVWTRLSLRVPYLPLAEHTLIRAAGHTVVGSLRWVTAPTQRERGKTMNRAALVERSRAVKGGACGRKLVRPFVVRPSLARRILRRSTRCRTQSVPSSSCSVGRMSMSSLIARLRGCEPGRDWWRSLPWLSTSSLRSSRSGRRC